MKFFKNKKGSILVEKILMTAFAVAAGGAVVVYGSNVLANTKNTEITGILGGGGHMSREELESHFDDDNFAFHLTQQELNSKSFSNLNNIIYNLDLKKMYDYNWFSNSTISVNNKVFEIDEKIYGIGEENYLCYWQTDGHSAVNVGYGFCGHNGISLSQDDDNSPTGYSPVSFTTDMVWNTCNEAFYQDVKLALIADLS